jgi:hypothetical protein
LAAVYIELTTTRQSALQLEPLARATSNIQAIVPIRETSEPLRRIHAVDDITAAS